MQRVAQPELSPAGKQVRRALTEQCSWLVTQYCSGMRSPCTSLNLMTMESHSCESRFVFLSLVAHVCLRRWRKPQNDVSLVADCEFSRVEQCSKEHVNYRAHVTCCPCWSSAISRRALDVCVLVLQTYSCVCGRRLSIFCMSACVAHWHSVLPAGTGDATVLVCVATLLLEGRQGPSQIERNQAVLPIQQWHHSWANHPGSQVLRGHFWWACKSRSTVWWGGFCWWPCHCCHAICIQVIAVHGYYTWAWPDCKCAAVLSFEKCSCDA